MLKVSILRADGRTLVEEFKESIMTDLNVHNIFTTPSETHTVGRVGIQFDDGSGVMYERADG